MKKLFYVCLYIVVIAVSSVASKSVLYTKNEQDKLEPVLIAVSSTVIPIPVYQVGFGIGLLDGADKDKIKKPDKPIKLITARPNKKKFVNKDKI